MRRFREHGRKGFTTTRIIALGFLGAIFVGTLLLMLPIATVAGETTMPVDALFTATTSVCVTGLVTVPTFSHWTIFGQVVIALLAQVGGLGVITFTIIFLLIGGRKIGLKERLLIQDAYNLDTIQGLVVLVKKVLKGTLIIEGIGARLYITVFVPEFGPIGVWKSIFNSISAFCNAGMDVLGNNSLEPYVDNVLVNMTTMLLIILGGLGFPVWWNIADILRRGRSDYRSYRRAFHYLKLHTKLVIAMTGILIVVGAVAVFVLEYSNTETLGNLPLWQKIQASLFQSVTTRTAGFATIPQSALYKSTALISSLLMFIGGSPSGTAGGIKTTTIAILIITVYSIIQGGHETELFGRRIGGHVVRRALAVFMVSLAVMLTALIALSIAQPGSFIDCFYETMSAIATVGLSRDFTSTLNLAGKIIIILTMYLGRIGPISLALLFNTKRRVRVKSYPEENVSVG